MTKAPVGPAAPAWPFSPALPTPSSRWDWDPDTGGWDGCSSRVRGRVGAGVLELVRARNGLRIGLPGDVPKKRAEKVTGDQVLHLILAERRREGNQRTDTTLDLG